MTIDGRFITRLDIASHAVKSATKWKLAKYAVRLDAWVCVNMVKPVSYLDLAKEARARGDHRGFWRAFIQHRRVMRKKKAAASTVAR